MTQWLYRQKIVRVLTSRIYLHPKWMFWSILYTCSFHHVFYSFLRIAIMASLRLQVALEPQKAGDILNTEYCIASYLKATESHTWLQSIPNKTQRLLISCLIFSHLKKVHLQVYVEIASKNCCGSHVTAAIYCYIIRFLDVFVCQERERLGVWKVPRMARIVCWSYMTILTNHTPELSSEICFESSDRIFHSWTTRLRLCGSLCLAACCE